MTFLLKELHCKYLLALFASLCLSLCREFFSLLYWWLPLSRMSAKRSSQTNILFDCILAVRHPRFLLVCVWHAEVENISLKTEMKQGCFSIAEVCIIAEVALESPGQKNDTL